MACGRCHAGGISGFPAGNLRRIPLSCQACALPRQNQKLWAICQPTRTIATSSQSRIAVALPSSLTSSTPLPIHIPGEPRSRFSWALHAAQEDFEVEGMVDFDDEEKVDEEEEELQDFETDYDVGGKSVDHDRPHDGDTFLSSRGEAAETVMDYKINEDEFHKLSLQHCDFFIRKVPDVDGDVFDFSEIYVTDPDTDVYAIPRADVKLPKKPVRLILQKHEHYCTIDPPVDGLRSPMVKNEMQVMKIFLMKHFKNRRLDSPDFVVDFDQIYVIDSKTKSISRAKVILDLPAGVARDRRREILLVHDDGATFTVIPESQRRSPDQLVIERQWYKSKKDLDNYLKSFRDYPISNWF